MFILPSVSLIRKTLRLIKVYPGFNKPVVENLGKKIQSMGKNGDISCLGFDEISLSKHFDQDGVEISGYEHFGHLGTTSQPADHALVFMVRGITGNWKQPIGYFLSSGPVGHDRLHKLLLDCLDMLFSVGINVKAIVCDQGSNNQSVVFSHLKLTEEKPFLNIMDI